MNWNDYSPRFEEWKAYAETGRRALTAGTNEWKPTRTKTIQLSCLVSDRYYMTFSTEHVVLMRFLSVGVRSFSLSKGLRSSCYPYLSGFDQHNFGLKLSLSNPTPKKKERLGRDHRRERKKWRHHNITTSKKTFALVTSQRKKLRNLRPGIRETIPTQARTLWERIRYISPALSEKNNSF